VTSADDQLEVDVTVDVLVAPRAGTDEEQAEKVAAVFLVEFIAQVERDATNVWWQGAGPMGR
jgi:hypothetical protein